MASSNLTRISSSISGLLDYKLLSFIWNGGGCFASDKSTFKRLSRDCYGSGQYGAWTLYMEIVEIWLWIGAVSNPKCSKHFLFTSDCCKHCIIFISASHTSLNQKWRQGRRPLLDILIVLFHLFTYFFLSSSCEISEGDAALTTEDFRTRGLARDGWRSIYITLPGASALLPSLSPFVLLFNLGNRGRKSAPRERYHGCLKRGHDLRGQEAVEPVITRRVVRSLQRSHNKGSAFMCNVQSTRVVG